MSVSAGRLTTGPLCALAGCLSLAGSGCGGKAAPVVPPVEASTITAAIDPSLVPVPVAPTGKNGWDEMVAAVSDSKHEKADLDLMGNAISANLKPQLLKTGTEKLVGFKDDIDKLEKCLNAPQWLAPARAGFDPPSKVLEHQRAIVSALCFRGRVRLGSKVPGGADDLISALSIADRMVRCNGCIDEVKTGMAERAFALRAIEQAAITNQLSDDELVRLAKVLDGDRESPEVLADCLKHEYSQVFAVAVSRVTFGAPKEKVDDAGFAIASIQPTVEQIIGSNPNAFDRAGTVKLGAPVVTAMVANTNTSWADEKPIAPMIADLAKGWPAALLEHQESLPDGDVSQAQNDLKDATNPYGKFLLATATPAWNSLFQSWYTMVTDVEGTRIIIAADQYSRAHGGALPADLAQLSTVKPAPIDSYADKPFRYDQARKLFWSVGPNQKDDGGKDKPGFFLGGKDLVFLLPGSGGYS